MDNIFDEAVATVEVFGNVDTIHNHIEKAKCYTNETFSYLKIGDKLLPKEYLTAYRRMLWCKFFKVHNEIDRDFIPSKFDYCLDFLSSKYGKEFSKLLKAEKLLILDKDIFLSEQDIICHQVNCMGVMGKGIAKNIREKYPKVFEEYKKLCDKTDNKKNLLGHCQICQVEENKYVANLFGQETYGNNGCFTNYKALEHAFVTLKQRAVKGNKSIAIPYGLGASLAGGSWEIISQIIENVFFDYPVILYRFEKRVP